jgi:hypothetical protein
MLVSSRLKLQYGNSNSAGRAAAQSQQQPSPLTRTGKQPANDCWCSRSCISYQHTTHFRSRETFTTQLRRSSWANSLTLYHGRLTRQIIRLVRTGTSRRFGSSVARSSLTVSIPRTFKTSSRASEKRFRAMNEAVSSPFTHDGRPRLMFSLLFMIPLVPIAAFIRATTSGPPKGRDGIGRVG